MDKTLSGVWPACPTFMSGDSKLDEHAMRRVVRMLCDAGVNGLWLLGGGGEGVTLSDDLRRASVEVALDEVSGAIPILVGVSAESTARALERYSYVRDLDIAGIFSTPPYYYTYEQSEIKDYYRALSQETGAQVFLYNNPAASRTVIDLETITALAELPEVGGVKDASGDFMRMQAILVRTKDAPGFTVFEGLDRLAAVSLLAGADGIVSAVGCFAPNLLIDLVAATSRADVREAFALQATITRIQEELGANSDVSATRSIKACLAAAGMCCGVMARPFAELTRDELERAKATMSTITSSM